MVKYSVLFLSIFFLTGCGLRGPLYLPHPEQDNGNRDNSSINISQE